MADDLGSDATPSDDTALSTVQGIQQIADGSAAIKDAMTVVAPNTGGANGDGTGAVPAAANAGGSPSWDPITMIRQAFTSGQAQVNSLMQELTGATQKNNAGAVQAGVGAQSAYDAAVGINNAVLGAAIQKNRDVAAQAVIDGTTPGHQGKVVADTAAAIQADQEDYLRRDADIRGRNSVGFLDDPVQWLVNRVVTPIENDTQDQVAKSLLNNQNFILKQQAQTLDSVQLAEATDAADASKELIAKNTEALGALQAKQAAILQDSAKFTQSAVSVRDTLIKNNFDQAQAVDAVTISFRNMLNDTARVGIAQQSLGLDKIRVGISQTQLDIEKSKLPYYQEATQALIDTRLQKVQDLKDFQGALTGLSAVTGANLTPKAVATMDVEQKTQLSKALASMPFGAIGPTTADALTFLGMTGVRGTVGMQYPISKLSQLGPEAANLVKADPNMQGKTYNSLKLSDRIPYLQSAIDNKVSSEFANRPDSGGIYSPDPISKTLPIIQKVAPELGKTMAVISQTTPLAATSAQTIYEAEINRVAKGELTPAQAGEEIASVYKAINQSMDAERNYKMLAMRPPATYNTTIASGMDWKGATRDNSIDLTNTSAVTNLITRRMISNRTPEVGYDAGGVGILGLPQGRIPTTLGVP